MTGVSSMEKLFCWSDEFSPLSGDRCRFLQPSAQRRPHPPRALTRALGERHFVPSPRVRREPTAGAAYDDLFLSRMLRVAGTGFETSRIWIELLSPGG